MSRVSTKDLVSCLDRIFGEDGEAFLGLKVSEMLEKVGRFVYPCPTVVELNTFLRVVPGMVIADEKQKEIAVLSNFRVSKNRVICKVDLIGGKKANPSLIESSAACAVRFALEQFLFAHDHPTSPGQATEC